MVRFSLALLTGNTWFILLVAEFYQQFLKDDFDVKEHASLVLQGSIVSEQLAKLSEGSFYNCLAESNCIVILFWMYGGKKGLTLLDKTIHNQVSEHYEDLLKHANGIETLENVIFMIQNHIQVSQFSGSNEILLTHFVLLYRDFQLLLRDLKAE